MIFLKNQFLSFIFIIFFLFLSSFLHANSNFFCINDSSMGAVSNEYILDENTNTVNIITNHYDEIPEWVISDSLDIKEYTWRKSEEGLDYIFIDYPDIDMWQVIVPESGNTRDSNGNVNWCIIVKMKLQCDYRTYFFGDGANEDLTSLVPKLGTVNNSNSKSGIYDVQIEDRDGRNVFFRVLAGGDQLIFDYTDYPVTRKIYNPTNKEKIIGDITACEQIF